MGKVLEISGVVKKIEYPGRGTTPKVVLTSQKADTKTHGLSKNKEENSFHIRQVAAQIRSTPIQPEQPTVPAQPRTPATPDAPGTYTMKKGDTLGAIVKAIYEGQVIVLPAK